MFDPWAPGNSVLREKLVEHLFVADLTRYMLVRRRTPVEILRSEFDAFGYDIVVEAGGIVRHIQLKTLRTGAKTHEVGINTALAVKPSGCVIWITVDPDTFDLGPFHWFGGAPGGPLPNLGERVGKHSKGNARGFKSERAGVRIVRRGSFRALGSIAEVASALFGDGRRTDLSNLLANCPPSALMAQI